MTVRYVRSWDDRRAFHAWFSSIPAWEWVACDVETSGLDPWGERLRLVQFGTTEQAWAIPFPQERDAIENAFHLERPLVGWNSKFDEQFLWNNGFRPRFEDDAKMMAHLLFSEQDLHLKSWSDQYLGSESSKADKELKALMRKNKWTWGTIPQDTYEYWFYGGTDTMLTARAAAFCYPQVLERGYDPNYQLELDVWHMVTDAERRGIGVDLEYCQEQLTLLEKEAADIQSYYPDVPLGGKKEVVALLESAGVKLPRTPPSTRFPKGQPKLDEDTLAEIDHPIAADIVKYRKLLKNAHTYFGAFLRLEVDGRVHTTLKTMEARTGRMSSSIPNLQNVPKREAGAYVRRAFVAKPGHSFINADFQQIEYRIFAAMAGEQKMIDAFLEGKDMHAVTAELVLGHEPSKKERDMAKNGNFSELYLAGLEKFAKTAEVSLDAARRFKTTYHKEFKRIKPFTRALIRYAQANLFAVETAFGRRIGVDAKKPYAAVNYDIQGTAADALKRAMRNIRDKSQWMEYFLLAIHDELMFEVPDELVDQCVAELPGLMEDHETFVVPLTVEVSIAKRWGETEGA